MADPELVLGTQQVGGGLEPEGRKFAPHIILAGNALLAGEPFPVAEFHLYSTQLAAKGAIHQL